MVPIVKKREGIRVQEYRGITLMSTLYKIYAVLMTECLKEDVERKKIVLRTRRELGGGWR